MEKSKAEIQELLKKAKEKKKDTEEDVNRLEQAARQLVRRE